jgi:hypothetical protein
MRSAAVQPRYPAYVRALHAISRPLQWRKRISSNSRGNGSPGHGAKAHVFIRISRLM